MKSHPLLILFFLSSCVCAEPLDDIARQMTHAPLSSISLGYAHLGIDRDELVAATRVMHPVRQEERQPFGTSAKDRKSPPPAQRLFAGWEECQEMFDKLIELSPAKKRLHRAIVFQTLVAKGWVAHAMRYAGSKRSVEQEKEWIAAAEALAGPLKQKIDADTMLIRIERMESDLGQDVVRNAIGEEFLFPSLLVDPDAEALSDHLPCLQPFRLLRNPKVQRELKMTVGQLLEAVKAEDKWLKKFGMVQVEAFYQNGTDYEYEGQPGDFSIAEANEEVLVAARKILTRDQHQRFDGLLIRNYLINNRVKLVPRILGTKFSKKELSRGLSTEIRAATHLRALQVYLPVILPAMSDMQKKKYLGYQFVPHTFNGNRAKRTSAVFKDFNNRILPQPSNPRRDR